MTDVINEAKVTDTAQQIEDEEPASEAPKAKAKAKRATRKQLAVAEPEVEVTPSLDEVQADLSIPSAAPKVETKVLVQTAGSTCLLRT